MRNIIVYLASSVNGLISNKAGIPDWLSEEFGQGFLAICQRAQAVIMGKTTYDFLNPDYLPLKGEGVLIVLTHDTSAKPSQSNVTFTDRMPQEIIDDLGARGFQEAVIIGGAQTVSEFVKAGVVTEIYLVVEPVLFGGGLPMLRGVDFDCKLTLLNVDKLNDNTVQFRYRLKKPMSTN